MKKLLIGAALAMAIPAMAETTSDDIIRASFPGGEKALQEYIESNRKYPAAALNHGIEGIVNVRFIVKTDGSLEQLSIVRLVDPDLEAEAIRLVKEMPAWQPATSNGIATDSEENVKIAFVLE